MEIKFIKAEETYNMRSCILRPGMPLESCKYPTDYKKETIHLGAFNDDKLVCIGSFHPEKHPDLTGEIQYRLRGMATDENYRKQGFALNLLRKAIDILKQRNTDVLWCNARLNALGLYEKAGMKSIGDIFEIEGIGPHYVMYMEL